MVGVLYKKKEFELVREFFQLFKTPWELYNPQKKYDVVISTKPFFKISTKLLIIYSSDKAAFNLLKGVKVQSQYRNTFVTWHDFEYPIYGSLVSFMKSDSSVISIKGKAEDAAIKINHDAQQIICVGYNVFNEISFLFSTTQPKENASIPTLEYHIAILRNWMLEAGVPVVEIPPKPVGYKCFVCLTHDVDFIGIRKHKFDHTIVGFIYRASLGSLVKLLKRKITWRKSYLNWKAVLSLPFVYAGLMRDFWYNFDKYSQIEKDIGSTYFFIPFKNEAGNSDLNTVSKRRATRYDISEVVTHVKQLMTQGCEIGLHGIDAWRDQTKAKQEYHRVYEITNDSEMGFRSHWLFFNEKSAQILDEAGFFYDSSFGYNDAIGFKAGTTQVFRPLGCTNLFEVPLHIMDTALFNPKKMNLSNSQAALLCDKMIKNLFTFGGILTINWHHRSLSEERLWGDFYIDLLKKLKAQRVCFVTAKEALKWFQKRRKITFKEVISKNGCLKIKLNGIDFDANPQIYLRIYAPAQSGERGNLSRNFTPEYNDIQLAKEMDFNFSTYI